ncbi:MAG: hypothetical protein EBZ59_06605 [Planctomycetia bacterium]|nr:hypothetical protein [Planctomycetia bacterium]
MIEGNQVWMTTAIASEVSADERAKRVAGKNNPDSLVVSGPVSLRALCVDRDSGRLLHDIELFRVDEPQPIHSLNSYASPTPILADGRLYCHFGDFGTACLDTRSGTVVWANRELRLNHENGPGSTPLLWNELLVVHCDGSDVQYIAALDAKTGRVAWKTDRSGKAHENPDFRKAYGTPLVVSAGGRDVLVSPAANWVYGYDPATGRELWRIGYDGLGFSIVPRPVAAHGLVFMSTSFTQPVMMALRLGDAGAAPAIVWREKRGAPTISSPLVVGDELYLVSDKGIATCLDAQTGATVWTERLGGNFTSSPLLADGRIYVGNRDGKTFVIRPGRGFLMEATNELDGQIMATPAAVDRAIYVRTDKAIYRIEKGRDDKEPAGNGAPEQPPAAAAGAAVPMGGAERTVRRGEVLRCRFEKSRIYPGTVRDYAIYVPAQYDGTTPACVHVSQDGIQFDAPTALDRLIHERKMPVTIGVFVSPGRVPAAASRAPAGNDRVNRSCEYDSMNGDYARFLLEELLPDAATKTTADGRPIRLSQSGNDRSIAGTSSGGICSFTAAWERPDAFSRVFSCVGSYTAIRGGQEYATLVRKVEPKPIRVFLEGGSKDLNIAWGDWWMANQSFQRSLAFSGYDVRHAWCDGGHDAKHGTAVFPEAMEWLWRDWPRPVSKGAGSPQLQEVLVPGEEWRLVGEGYRFTEGPAASAAGDVFFNDVGDSKTYRVTADWRAEVWLADSGKADGQAFAPDGRLVAASAAVPGLVARDAAGTATTLAAGWRPNDVVVDAAGVIYATEPGWDGTSPSRIHVITTAADGTRVDRAVESGLKFANGICLSTDQGQLFVADSRSHCLRSFIIQPDGSLAHGQRFHHLQVPDTADDSGADGIRCDRDGRVWVATRMGIQVCDQVGRLACIIPTPNGRVSNLCFGGPEFDMLLATCGDRVFVRKVRAKGALPFQPPLVPPKPKL